MKKTHKLLSGILLASSALGLLGCQSSQTISPEMSKVTEQFIIGTYTQNGSQGVYKVTLDADSQTLSNNGVVALGTNPSYLALSKKQDWFFAATGKESGSIDTFLLDEQSNSYKLQQHIKGLGKDTCHISLNPQETQLAVANYSSSDVYLFDIHPETKALTQKGYFKNKGTGPSNRQEKSHMHYVQWDKSGRFLYAVDLGTDEVIAFDAQDKSFSPIVAAKLTAGDGPRHLTFHPTKPWVYVLNELSNSLAVFSQDAATGKLTLKQQTSMLMTPSKNNTSSAIKISDDGQYIYAGVRGINEIAVFKINADGFAKLLQSHPTLGNWPRDINLSADQKHLLIANQKSNTITVLNRDKKTGLLSSSPMTLNISTPSYIGNYK